MPLTQNKELALRSYVNVWLREPTTYCNMCGNVYHPNWPPCCENPQIGNNFSLTQALIKENKKIRDSRDNDFASNKTKDIRWGISILPRLLHDLEEYSEKTLKEKLWKDDKELMDFMRAFPEFTIAKSI
jgi:hypothetical protein